MRLLEKAIRKIVPAKTSRMLLDDTDPRKWKEKHVDSLYDPSNPEYRIEQGERQLEKLKMLRMRVVDDLASLEGLDDIPAYKRRKELKKMLKNIDGRIKKVAFQTELDRIDPKRLERAARGVNPETGEYKRRPSKKIDPDPYTELMELRKMKELEKRNRDRK